MKIISFILASLIPLLLGYFIIRIAVRDGIKAAAAELKKDNIL